MKKIILRGRELRMTKGTEEIIKARLKERFTIVLESNPTTGYKWEAKFDENEIELVRKEFELDSERIGGGGKEKFNFIGLKRGETRLEMVYKRSWEDKPVKTKTFIVEIR